MHGFISLDRASAWHLARALERHRVACRVDGIHLPAALEDLAGHAEVASKAERSDTDRQEPPNLYDAPGTWSATAVVATTVPLLLNTADAADALGIGKRTAERLVPDGVLPSVKVGGLRRIRVVDLEAYVAAIGAGDSDGGAAA